jgi:dihydroxy-acid dehydratase
VPCLSKVAPAKNDVHMEDVHRAGGIYAILGELERAGCCTPICPPCTAPRCAMRWPVGHRPQQRSGGAGIFLAAPGGVPTQVAFSQNRRWDALDRPRKGRDPQRRARLFQDGGLAVLFGNIALEGCIVKTAGVDESILKFTGPAKVYESQDAAVTAILTARSWRAMWW